MSVDLHCVIQPIKLQMQCRLPFFSLQAIGLGEEQQKLQAVLTGKDLLLKTWRPQLDTIESGQQHLYTSAFTSGQVQVQTPLMDLYSRVCVPAGGIAVLLMQQLVD